MIRIVLDYSRDEYVFPDGKVLPRVKTALLDNSPCITVQHASQLEGAVLELAKRRRDSPLHYQAYMLGHSASGIGYEVHFLLLQGEPCPVSDAVIMADQRRLYQAIAGLEIFK